jgi:broad specificity phosphatase PhoE
MKIILVRHGETWGNREGIFRGRKDFPLNQNGLRQAQEVAADLRHWKIDAIYSSPLRRALDTAAPLSQALGLTIVQEPGFTDIGLGDWEGKSKQEVAREQPEWWRLWISRPERLARPGAESLSQVQDRAFRTLERIVHEAPGQTIAVVSHRAVLKALIARCLNIPEPYFWKIHLDTGSYSLLEHRSEVGYILTLLNQTRHLSDLVEEKV